LGCVILFLAKGRFAAVGLAPFCVLGTGYARIPGTSVGQLVVVLSAATLGWLWLRNLRHGSLRILREINEWGGLYWLLGLALLLFAKCLVDTILLGNNLERQTALKYCLTSVLFPCLTVYLAACLQGARRAVTDVMTGGYLLTGIWVGAALAGTIADGQFRSLTAGTDRLLLHNMDTITSVRLLPMLSLTATYVFLTRQGLLTKGLALAAVIVVFPILMLNGTRQILLTVLAQFLLVCCACRSRALRAALAFGLAGCALVLIAQGLFRDSSLNQRLSGSEIQHDERFETWGKVLAAAWEHPFTGLGFRVFGKVEYIKDLATGKIAPSQDTAHGLFMDVLADHGLILGMTLFGLYLLLALKHLALCFTLRDDLVKLSLIAFLTWPIALLFSGTFWDAFGFFLPLGLALSLQRDGQLQPDTPASALGETGFAPITAFEGQSVPSPAGGAS
jgi:hypothetical protein